jgi:hypothetical protein
LLATALQPKPYSGFLRINSRFHQLIKGINVRELKLANKILDLINPPPLAGRRGRNQ